MSAELLTLISAKSVDLLSVGGKSGITREDILQAMASCDEDGLCLMLARVCEDRSAREVAFYSLVREVAELAIERRWKIRERGEEKLRSLVQLALLEIIDMPRCKRCKGVGHNKAQRTCHWCGGTGYWQIRDRHRANAMGVSPSSWSRYWSDRYALVIRMVQAKEYEASRIMRKVLR